MRRQHLHLSGILRLAGGNFLTDLHDGQPLPGRSTASLQVMCRQLPPSLTELALHLQRLIRWKGSQDLVDVEPCRRSFSKAPSKGYDACVEEFDLQLQLIDGIVVHWRLRNPGLVTMEAEGPPFTYIYLRLPAVAVLLAVFRPQPSELLGQGYRLSRSVTPEDLPGFEPEDGCHQPVGPFTIYHVVVKICTAATFSANHSPAETQSEMD